MFRRAMRHAVVRARKLVDVSLVALALGATLSLVEELAGALGSGLSALAAVAVTVGCNRMAARSAQVNLLFHLWRLLPGVLFVAVPFVIDWVSGDELSVFGVILLYAKPLLIFVVPLLLLTLADRQLRAALAAEEKPPAPLSA